MFMQSFTHFSSPLGKRQADSGGDAVLIVRIAVWLSAQTTSVLPSVPLRLILFHIVFFGGSNAKCFHHKVMELFGK